MKLTKKWISVLLVLCLVLSAAPLHAHAEEEIVIQQTETITFENPVYRNAGNVNVTFQPRQTLSTAYAPEDFLSDISAAAAVLREGLTKRQAVTTVLFQAGADEDYALLAGSILNVAFAHTGVPTEGDYLYMQWDTISCPASYYIQDNTAYYAIDFMVTYYTTAEQEAQVDAAVAQLLSDLAVDGLSDYEALCAVYDWMCANIEYDYTNLNNNDHVLKYTAYAALINRTSVCQGYAVLLYRLMLELGIDCRVITGYGNGEDHAWNIVELDGVYYNLDATWDATYVQSGGEYGHFLRSESNFADHSRDPEYAASEFYAVYPMAESDYSIEHLHSYIAAVTAPTCTEAGFTTYACECGYSYVTDRVEALGHAPGEALCTEQVFCTVCGEVCAEAGPHAYAPEWNTGDTTGHWHDCTNCTGHSEPEAHTPNVSAATNETAQFCTVCGYVMQEQVPAGTVTVVAEGLWDHGPVKWKITSDGVLTISGKRSIQEKTEYIWKDYSDIITRIVLEDGITNVPKKGFSGMENVTSVYLSNKIEYIGEAAFASCDKLTEISIPASVTEIEKRAFYGCDSLAVLTFEEGSKLETIGEYAFYGIAITELITPESLTTIDAYAFQDCTALQDVHLTDGIQEVLYYAFDGCSGLKNIYLPESLADVGGHAFDGCYAIEKLEIYSPATFDGFPNRTALKTVVMDGAVTRIGSSFFENCTALTDVTLGENIEIIESYAFNGCTSLTTLTLPEKITAIKTRAFANTGLFSLTIPAAVTEVEMLAFENSTIKEITFLGDAPTFVMNSFSGVTATATYPGDNATWTEEVRQNYEGNITWVSSTGHIHEYTVVTVDPTCTEAGSVTYTCECGYSYTKTLDALGHDLTTATCIVPAACKREGCTYTSETLGDHNYAAKITDPTCTEQGYMTFTCTYCGDSYKDNYTDPQGHRWGEGVVTAPTCTEPGYTTHTCTACGDSYTDSETKQTGHAYTTEITKQATCTEPGIMTYTCANDGCTHSFTEEIAAKGHTEVIDATVAPSCTATGLTEGKHCEICGAVTVAQTEVPATGHAWDEGTISTQPGEYTEGEKTFQCRNCEETKTEPIPPLGHTHSHTSVVTQPTCTEQGYTTYTCECGDSYVDDYVDATGHSFGEWVTVKEPTEETEGKAERKCACGEVESKVLPKLESGLPKLGDVNNDGRLNAKDATLILRYSVKKYNDYPAWFEQIADVNGDGRINAKDATLILRFVVGKADIPGWER